MRLGWKRGRLLCWHLDWEDRAGAEQVGLPSMSLHGCCGRPLQGGGYRAAKVLYPVGPCR